ncbi:YceK/YidQ family lipoprotein [Pseudomonas sp. MAFF212427]|uniref:YceK/YidQ family lipoprotein n=1 Tax=Pseudomonas brassicae TaxID=2708063 RepID=A0A6B3P2D7_9PSED|nr:YceK/YidQ family lipoprotein [Pseudomonas brassicae]
MATLPVDMVVDTVMIPADATR